MQVGDHVLIERGRTPGRVREVIEADTDLSQWNIEEPGLMVEAAPFGLVFWPASSPDAVVLVGRGRKGYRAVQRSPGRAKCRALTAADA